MKFLKWIIILICVYCICKYAFIFISGHSSFFIGIIVIVIIAVVVYFILKKIKEKDEEKKRQQKEQAEMLRKEGERIKAIAIEMKCDSCGRLGAMEIIGEEECYDEKPYQAIQKLKSANSYTEKLVPATKYFYRTPRKCRYCGYTDYIKRTEVEKHVEDEEFYMG